MTDGPILQHWSVIIQLIGSVAQSLTAVFALVIARTTFLHTRKQNALAAINENNNLANSVNLAILNHPDAAAYFQKLRSPEVGPKEDALLYMYLNYVHNAYRTKEAGALNEAVWKETLEACIRVLSTLNRQQVQRLLVGGYEPAFQKAVLAAFDLLLSNREQIVGDPSNFKPSVAT